MSFTINMHVSTWFAIGNAIIPYRDKPFNLLCELNGECITQLNHSLLLFNFFSQIFQGNLMPIQSVLRIPCGNKNAIMLKRQTINNLWELIANKMLHTKMTYWSKQFFGTWVIIHTRNVNLIGIEYVLWTFFTSIYGKGITKQKMPIRK